MNFFENKFLLWLLLPLTWLYWLIIFLRNKFYDWHIFKIETLACPVICVGNITVGGTGKTPVVQYLAEFLRNRLDRKVVVLSRGYRRQSSGTVIVTDGSSITVTPQEAGDEPFLLAQRLKSIPVVVDEDRVRGGREIIRRFQPDVIVLDDGFQHRKLARDLNIAVINGKVGFGNGYLLPAGPLREPVSALGRANLIWFNQATQSDVAKNFQQKMTQFSKTPCIYSNYVVSGVTTIPVREHFSPELLKQKKIFAFSGIANPARFKASLLEMGPSFVDLMTFPDHHSFSAADLDKIGQRIGRLNPDFVLTTEKDAMRLPAGIPFTNKLYFLEIKVVVNNEDMLENILKNQVVKLL